MGPRRPRWRATSAAPTLRAGVRWPRPSAGAGLPPPCAESRLSSQVRRSLVLDETGVLDLIEESSVADAEQFGSADPVPVGLLERLENRLTLGGQSSLARDLLERYAGLDRQRSKIAVALAVGRFPGPRGPREVGIAQDDHPLDDVLEFPDIAGITIAHQALEGLSGEGEALVLQELRVAIHEVLGEEGNLLGALAQSGD